MFSRAEYALKATEFLSSGRYDQPIVEWAKFADSADLFAALQGSDDSEFVEAVGYLTAHPPQSQVLENGVLRWRSRKKRSNESNSAFLIKSVTTVRNNLFHGGKELTTPLAERDQRLVRSALVVLAHAISLNEAVWRAFNDVGSDVAVA